MNFSGIVYNEKKHFQRLCRHSKRNDKFTTKFANQCLRHLLVQRKKTFHVYNFLDNFLKYKTNLTNNEKSLVIMLLDGVCPQHWDLGKDKSIKYIIDR